MHAMTHLLSTLPQDTKTAITLIFNDTSSNDFNTLAATILSRLPASSTHYPITPLMLPGSFYTPLLPPYTANIALSFSSLHYLETALPPLTSMPTNAEDWETHARENAKKQSVPELIKFFRLRAEEVAVRGHLIAAFPAQRQDDDRVWWGLGLAMRSALLSAVEEGWLDKELVLGHGAWMGTRTVEQVEEALAAVADMWELKKLGTEDIEHSGYVEYQKAGGGKEAYREFAESLVAMTYTVYIPFLLRAIRKAKVDQAGTDGAMNVTDETEEEQKIVRGLQRRCLEYYLEHYMGFRFWMPFVYLKLVRI